MCFFLLSFLSIHNTDKKVINVSSFCVLVMLMKCREARKNGNRCVALLLTTYVFSDFYFSHGGGLVAITEFVFHCVN